MLPLKFPWLWRSLGWLLVAGVVAGSLLPAPMVASISIRDKFLHAGAYGVLMLWFAGLYRRERHWIVALLLGALGLALDFAQSGIATRAFELGDVAANAGGILVGLALSWFLLAGWCGHVERWLFR